MQNVSCNLQVIYRCRYPKQQLPFSHTFDLSRAMHLTNFMDAVVLSFQIQYFMYKTELYSLPTRKLPS
jgi:hypothetical protein